MSFQNLKFMCGAKFEKWIFASCAQFNSLVKIDIETGDTQFLGKFPNEPLSCEYMHKNTFIMGEDIYFIPYRATNICKYNVMNGTFQEIVIGDENYHGGYIAEQIADKIYMIPEMPGGSILQLDTRTDKIETVVTKNRLLRETKPLIEDGMVFFRICAVENRLFLPLKKSNRILEINVSNKNIKSHELEIGGLLGCFTGQKGIWILGDSKDKIYHWDVTDNEIKSSIYYSNNEGSRRCINWIVDMGEDVYALPAWGRHILRLEGNKFVKMEQFEENNIEVQKFYTPIKDNGLLYLLPMGINDLVILQKEKIVQIPLKTMNENTKLYSDIIHAYMDNSSNEILEEGIKLNLEQFVNALT